jgi:hypothetical protein
MHSWDCSLINFWDGERMWVITWTFWEEKGGDGVMLAGFMMGGGSAVSSCCFGLRDGNGWYLH